MELILGLVLIVIVYVASKSTEWKFDNYMPPEGQRIDHNAQAQDMVKNHLTKEYIKDFRLNNKKQIKQYTEIVNK